MHSPPSLKKSRKNKMNKMNSDLYNSKHSWAPIFGLSLSGVRPSYTAWTCHTLLLTIQAMEMSLCKVNDAR